MFVAYKLGEEELVYEDYGTEIVIVNFVNGFYYNIKSTGVLVWNRIKDQKNVQEILTELLQEYDVAAETVLADLQQFIAVLAEDNIIVKTQDIPFAEKAFLAAYPGSDRRGLKKYEPVAVQKFTDMQYLLLLDPIHDIDKEFGWPIEKKG